MDVTTKKIPVKVEREYTLVDECDVYRVDKYTDELGHETWLLWDTGASDEFAIGYKFYDYYFDDDSRKECYVFSSVKVMPDKRTAMQTWLDLTKED